VIFAGGVPLWAVEDALTDVPERELVAVPVDAGKTSVGGADGL